MTLTNSTLRRLRATIGLLCSLSLLAPAMPVWAAPATSTTTMLASSPNPVNAGSPTVLTATVTGNNPAGTVSFVGNGNTLGMAHLGGSGNTRSAVLTTTVPGTGTGTVHITAIYSGDASNSASASATLAQAVTNTPSGNNTANSANAKSGASARSIMAQGGAMLLGGNAKTDSSSNTPLFATQGSTVVTAHAVNPMTWLYGYDAMGRTTTLTDPNNKTVTTTYDKLGRPIQTQQAVGSEQAITRFAYNGADSLTKLTDPRNLETTYSPTGLGTVTAQASPDTGSASATYDANGNLKTKTDARGKTTTHSYDALNRLTKLDYPTGVDTTLEYDGGTSPQPALAGELTKLTDESGSTTYGYDSAGRLSTKTQISNGKTFVVTYSWGDTGSALDKLTAITYPSGNRVNYSYDSFGAVSAITLNKRNANGVGFSGTASPLLSAITRNASGQVTGWAWASGKTQTLTYDQYGQPSGYKLGDPAGSGIRAGSMRTLGYDGAGHITAYSHSNTGGAAVAGLNQGFAYDDLGRLVTATIGSSTIQYSYDLNGNRSSKVISGTAYTNTVSPTSNRLTQTGDAGGGGTPVSYTIQYDAAGNVTNDGVNGYIYSDRGRLSSATTAGGVVNYRYNGFEQRTYKTGPSSLIPTGAAYYVYDDAGKLLGEYDANQTPIYETVYLNTSPVGVLKQTGTAQSSNIATSIYNVYADHLATPRVITRATDEAVVWRWDSAEAFGATAPNQNPNALGAFMFNQRLPGQVFDAETGLFQNHHREYSARLGRYLQSDPIGLAGGINTYAYASANPLSGIDPTGLLEHFTYDIDTHTLTHESCECMSASGQDVFSGNGANANDRTKTHIPETGPIPAGTYLIVEPYTYSRNPLGRHAGMVFFKLYRDDGKHDDQTSVPIPGSPDSVTRDKFRFHPGSGSNGCITLRNTEIWKVIQESLLKTKTEKLPSGVVYYGTMTVK